MYGTSAAVNGGAIYDAGELTFSGDVSLGISGDVYLCDGKYINVTQTLSGGNIVASLTMQNSSSGLTAVRFTSGLTADRSRFKLNSSSWELTVSGQNLITSAASANQAHIGGTEYATLAEAFAAAEDGDVITLIENTSLTSGITVNSNVTLSSPGGYVLGRATSFDGNLLTVSAGGILTLGKTNITDSLVLDGGSREVSGHIIEVSCTDTSGNNAYVSSTSAREQF